MSSSIATSALLASVWPAGEDEESVSSDETEASSPGI
jgi:hypothetical protein